MAIYRFRVSFEENEDIQRDIEIKSNQTFADFHSAIQEAIKFDNKHAASFFVSDDYWRKNLEITLLEEDLEADVKLMSKVKISSQIETPYQRFIYIFDKKVQWTFLVELIKILSEEPKKVYPCCTKSLGIAPKQYKLIKPISEEPLLPNPHAGPTPLSNGKPVSVPEEDEEEEDDDDAYHDLGEENQLVDEEDVKQMEGELEEEEEGEAMEDGGESSDDEYGEMSGEEDDKY